MGRSPDPLNLPNYPCHRKTYTHTITINKAEDRNTESLQFPMSTTFPIVIRTEEGISNNNMLHRIHNLKSY